MSNQLNQLSDLTQFAATHTIFAKPMNLGEYNNLRGWTIPADEDPSEEGFLIVHGNKKPEAILLSDLTWAKKSTFENKYTATDTFDQRLKLELVELLGRSVSLATYIESGKIKDLPVEQSSALMVQSELMATLGILISHRISALSPNYKDGRPNYATFNQPALSTSLSWPMAQLFLVRGYTVTRAGWNGKNQFVAYNPGQKALPAERYWVKANALAAEANGGTMDVAPHFTIKTANDVVQPGWIPSAGDLLAVDWVVLTM